MIRYKLVQSNRLSMFANGKYQIKYNKGKIIKSISNTVGLMCFDYLDSLIKFKYECGIMNCLTLRVDTIGKEVFDPFISNLHNSNFLDTYYELQSKINERSIIGYYNEYALEKIQAPEGTVVCQELLVLD
jgi:hypothetical protein